MEIYRDKPGQETQQYLTFLIAGEEHAISILKVREIIEFDVVTTIPNTPPWVKGVINLRGSVIPIIDLAVKFGLPKSTTTKLSCVVITEVRMGGETLVLGVLADSVSQVVDLTADDVEAAPAFGTRVKLDYLLGMGTLGKKFCLILDIDKVLSVNELIAMEESAQAADDKVVPPGDAAILAQAGL